MQIDRFSQRMIELLPRLIRGISQHESNSLSRGDITLPQLWALEHLARRQGCPMHELAQALGISRPAATGLMSRLITQRLASREHDRQDRRVVRVTISPKGRRILSNIWGQKRRAIAAVFSQLSAADRAQYLAILERVVETLSQAERSQELR